MSEFIEEDKSKIILGEPIVRSVSILSFRLRVIHMSLGQSVILGVYLECACGDKTFTDYKEIMIQGEEYLAWGTDDTYITELVKSKLLSIL